MTIEVGQLWQLHVWTSIVQEAPKYEIVLIMQHSMLSHDQYGADYDLYECLTDDGTLKIYPQWIFNTAKLLENKKDKDE
jgi:hypothetical protein